VSNARRAPALFGVSALLVLGGTTVMAGTLEQGQPVSVASESSVATVARAAAILQADRALSDRLARAALAQQVADQRRAAASKAHKAHLVAVANANARKAAATKKAAAVAAQRKATAAAAARKAAAARSARSSVRSIAPFTGSNRTLGRQMAAARGWTGDQWVCLNNLWTKESGWRHKAASTSGAYGIPQALPGSKMASAGSDWKTNPATQIEWGLNYIDNRYGTPCSAWRHFQAKRWY